MREYHSFLSVPPWFKNLTEKLRSYAGERVSAVSQHPTDQRDFRTVIVGMINRERIKEKITSFTRNAVVEKCYLYVQKVLPFIPLVQSSCDAIARMLN